MLFVLVMFPTVNGTIQSSECTCSRCQRSVLLTVVTTELLLLLLLPMSAPLMPLLVQQLLSTHHASHMPQILTVAAAANIGTINAPAAAPIK